MQSDPLHSNTDGDTFVNPFELSDDIPSTNLNTTIEPDDSGLSTDNKSNKSQTKAKNIIPKTTATINIEQTPTPISGSIGQQTRPYVTNTLDEPVSATILRDLRNVAIKLQQVLYPSGHKDILRDWDLWGPLILCLSLAVILSYQRENDGTTVFTGVFVIVWCGSAVVTINAKLLGGAISFFQSVCTLGYCIFPLVLVAFAGLLIKRFLIKLPLVIVALGWSLYASVNFFSASRLENRRTLAVYPLFLFYFMIGWMVLMIDDDSLIGNS